MTLSVIIVSYNVRDFLGQAITSLKKALRNIEHEIFVVDNASSDGTVELVEKRFPDVKLIANTENFGFGKANNQAIQQSKGDYLCVINPDTIVQEDTFTTLLSFFDTYPDAGALTCKILNPDGTLQLACRRSFPTPWVAFTKISGLANLFPKSRLFGRYNLTYLDPEQFYEVEAISGSFMLVRKETVDKVGGFDEDFFMYGEDLDWCYRIRQGGYKIYYVPDTQIIHFKGESSKKSPLAQRKLFYEAMNLFVNKHFSGSNAILPSWFLNAAVKARAMLAFFSALIRYMILPGIDFLFLTLSLSLAILFRFYPEFPWLPFLKVHLLYTLVWIFSMTAHGVYYRYKYSGSKCTSAVLLGWVVNSALTFFLNQWGFSRFVVLVAGGLNLVFLPGWRVLLKWFARRSFGSVMNKIGDSIWHRRSVIVGDAQASKALVDRIQKNLQDSYHITGIILTSNQMDYEEVAGLPVLGTFQHINEIIRREKVQEVIFATDRIDYNKMLSVIAGSNGGVSFKMVPSNLDVIIGKASIDYIDDLPFVDIDYKLHINFYRGVKRSFDFTLALLLMIVTAPLYVWLRWINRKSLTAETHYYSANREYTLYHFKDEKKILLKYLPRLSAILNGTISFVGRDIYAGNTDLENPVVLSLKPGITGYEQINRHSETDKDRNKYNIYYLKNYSMVFDVQILLKSLLQRKHP